MGKKGRKRKEGEKRKVNVSTDVVNYPIKQFSLKSKNGDRNLLSHVLIAFDGTKNQTIRLHIMFSVLANTIRLVKKN